MLEQLLRDPPDCVLESYEHWKPFSPLPKEQLLMVAPPQLKLWWSKSWRWLQCALGMQARNMQERLLLA